MDVKLMMMNIRMNIGMILQSNGRRCILSCNEGKNIRILTEAWMIIRIVFKVDGAIDEEMDTRSVIEG